MIQNGTGTLAVETIAVETIIDFLKENNPFDSNIDKCDLISLQRYIISLQSLHKFDLFSTQPKYVFNFKELVRSVRTSF